MHLVYGFFNSILSAMPTSAYPYLKCFYLIALCFLSLGYFPLSAQETKRITRKFEKSSQVSQRYDVLKSDKNTIHGVYERYFRIPRTHYKSIRHLPDSLERYIWQRGTYTNGKKNGRWIEYSSPGVLYSEGSYQNGKQTGLWIISRENGEVLERYDFTTRQRLVPEIRTSINYPPRARKAGIQGEVLIQYQVETDCSVSKVEVLQSLGAECDREATQKLLKYFRYLKEYGPAQGCETKTDTFRVRFKLE